MKDKTRTFFILIILLLITIILTTFDDKINKYEKKKSINKNTRTLKLESKDCYTKEEVINYILELNKN